MDISVAIPLYNKESSIESTVQSVLNQSFENFEIVIVDDGSTDRSYEVAHSIQDARIRLVRQKNAGVSVARNRAAQEARADLVAFLDADDEWKPTFLKTILGLRQQYPNAGAYATAYDRIEVNGDHAKLKYAGIPEPPWDGLIPNYFYTALYEQPVWSSAVAVPTQVLSEIGGFPAGVALGEDTYVWGKIALKYPIAFSTETGAVYRTDAPNRACLSAYRESSAFSEFALQAIRDGEVDEESVCSLKEYIAKEYIDMASQSLYGAKKPDMTRRLLNSVSYTHVFRKKWYYLYCLSFMPDRVVQAVLRTRLSLVRH